MKTNLATHELPVASTGWIGLRDRKKDQSLYSAKQLVKDLKFKLVDWDGRWVLAFFLHLFPRA